MIHGFPFDLHRLAKPVMAWLGVGRRPEPSFHPRSDAWGRGLEVRFGPRGGPQGCW